MSNLMQSIDDPSRLASTNRLEVLLFSLGKDKGSGREDVFGINVFKVKEVMNVPDIVRVPDMPESVEGMISLRGISIPVINLPRHCGVSTETSPGVMIVSESNKHVQGLLVHSVDSIQHLSREEVKAPPATMSGQHGGLVTSVVDVMDKGPVMIVDVEKMLPASAGFYDEDTLYDGIPSVNNEHMAVLFADDSNVARGQIRRTLEEMGVKYISTVNGREAWEKLNEIAAHAEAEGGVVTDRVQFILTDIEMPEMDGYALTRKIKSDDRFKNIPVVMHSSLGTAVSQASVADMGGDAYVAKFGPRELADTLAKMMAKVI